MDSWIFILLYRLKSNSIIIYFVAKIAPALSLQAAPVFFWQALSFWEHFLIVLVLQDALGSFCIPPAPALDIITFPRSPDSFYWIMVFKKQELRC